MVALVKAAFRGGYLAKARGWQMVLLIPRRGVKDFKGIVLVEILWKATNSIINRRLTTAVKYRNSLHGLRTGRGTGTDTLEANMIHQLTDMR